MFEDWTARLEIGYPIEAGDTVSEFRDMHDRVERAAVFAGLPFRTIRTRSKNPEFCCFEPLMYLALSFRLGGPRVITQEFFTIEELEDSRVTDFLHDIRKRLLRKAFDFICDEFIKKSGW